jgi:hypothetical protein
MLLRSLFLLFLICTIFAIPVFSQADASKIQELNQQMSALYQKGDLDGAIPLAEQIVKLQRQAMPLRPQSLITSLENLGQIKLARFKKENADMELQLPNPTDTKTLVERIPKDAKDTEAALREAIGLAKENSTPPTEQIVGMENNLGWLLYSFFPSRPNAPAGFDRLNRQRFDDLNKAQHVERVAEAKGLFEDALKRAEAGSEKDSDIVLSTLFNLAAFETAMANFENAVPYYKRCIETVERKYGKNSPNLLPPLKSYAKILSATAQDDQLFEVMSRIVRISGKSMQAPKELLNLSLRSTGALATWTSPDVIKRAEANRAKVELATRGSGALAGAGGEAAYSQILGNSTLGRDYYPTPDAVRLHTVPVKVLVDENGKVLEAEALTNDNEVKTEAEKIVKVWTFRPYIDDGKKTKLKGYVECLFMMEQFTK